MFNENDMNDFLCDIVDFTREIEAHNQKIAEVVIARPSSCKECSAERKTAKRLLRRNSE